MAINEDFSIIQGPPGTGKTLTIAAIVVNWLRSDAGSFIQTLVCAPSNTAADYLAERLFPLLGDKMVRYYPTKREDLFNLTMENVRPSSLLAAVIKECRAAPAADKSDPLSDYCHFLDLAKIGKVVVISDDEKDDYDKGRVKMSTGNETESDEDDDEEIEEYEEEKSDSFCSSF